MWYISVTKLTPQTVEGEAATSFPFLLLGRTGGRGRLRGLIIEEAQAGRWHQARLALEELIEESVLEYMDEEQAWRPVAIDKVLSWASAAYPALGLKLAER